MKSIVVLPTYNEVENLPQMVETLLGLDVSRLEVLVVDDGSPDGTGDVAERLAKEHLGQVHVLHRKGKLGLGSAYLTGFDWALRHWADYVVQIDCDFSHPPEKIVELLDKAREYDLVLGSRYVLGGKVDPGWSLWRRALSSWGNLYARLVTGIKTRDVTGGFKCFTRSALEGLPLTRIRSEGFTFQVEMNYACKVKGYQVAEVPFEFVDRTRGQSKMSVGIILEGIWRVWQIRFRSY